MALAVIPDIAVHFEFASELGELRPKRADMAGRAGLAGLACEAGDGLGRPRHVKHCQEQGALGSKRPGNKSRRSH